MKLSSLLTLSTTRTADPASAGIDRFVGLEHIEPENLHIRSWGNVADGTTFTNTIKCGQALASLFQTKADGPFAWKRFPSTVRARRLVRKWKD